MEDRIIGVPINERGYGTIPKKVMQDRSISVTAKAIYAYFSSFTGGGNTCFPTRNKICYDLGISNDTLGKHLKQLVDTGYIKVEQIKENGRFSHNVYTIQATILPVPKISDTVNFGTDKSDTNNNSLNKNNIFNNNSKEKERAAAPTSDDSTHAQNIPESNNTGSKKKSQETKHKYGEYGWVLLTDGEYKRLREEYGEDCVTEKIRYVDESAQTTGNKNKWKDWNLVLRKAIKNDWGSAFNNRKGGNHVGSDKGHNDSNINYEKIGIWF